MNHNTLPSLVTKCKLPTSVAITAPGRKPLRYSELERHIYTVGAALDTAGIARDDRVAVVLPNGPEMAVAFLAVASHAACAPLNPAYTADDFGFYLDDLQVRALIVLADSGSPVLGEARRRNIVIMELHPCRDAPAGTFTLGGMDAPPQAGSTATAQAGDIALVLHTSGTTSRPKQVPLTHANLCASARHIAAVLHLSASDRCLNILPLFHIHGLAGAVLSSLAACGSVACTPGLTGGRFFDWLDELRPTWYTGVPAMHQNILATAGAYREITRRNPLRFIRSSSAALPPQVMTALEQCFNAPVIEAYGMTEAAHQMASNPLPPDARKPGSAGIAAGSEIAIMSGAGDLLPAGERGEIVICGPNVMHGYHANPEANHSAYSHGWFRTGDQGWLDEQGYLYITGRIKEMINRGGEKITPREIDEVLLDYPGVAQAAAFAAPHPTLGEDLAAAVVLHPGATATEKAIRDFAFARLPGFKVPSQVFILDEIPKGPTGKIQRIGLADKIPDHFQRHHVPPRNGVEAIIAEIFSAVLRQKHIGTHDNFFALGGDSLSATMVSSRIRAVLQMELPIAALFRYPTVAELAQEILQQQNIGASPSDLTRILAELEHLSDEDAARQLANAPVRQP